MDRQCVGIVVVVMVFTLVQGAPPGIIGNLMECSPICPLDMSPVCGSNFNTYPNQCALDYADCVSRQTMKKPITRAYNGDCPTAGLGSMGQTGECNTFCMSSYNPVCGTDGQTYSSPCTFQTSACQKRQNHTHIFVAYLGKCLTVNPDCMKVCPMNFKPICGSNGISYPNSCTLEVASCFAEASNMPTITKKGGKCLTDCLKVCPLNFQAICGSNGISYPNLCLLEVASCFAEASNMPTITKKGDGMCSLS